MDPSPRDEELDAHLDEEHAKAVANRGYRVTTEALGPVLETHLQLFARRERITVHTAARRLIAHALGVPLTIKENREAKRREELESLPEHLRSPWAAASDHLIRPSSEHAWLLASPEYEYP